MNFNIKLTTLTPVFIGSGEVLSPYSDYIYDNGFVYIIDAQKVNKLFKENPKLINIFVNGVRKDTNNEEDKYTLKKIFQNENIDFKNFVKTKIKVKGDIKNIQINKFIESGGRKYIPGSSIKGAIRTAILFDILNKDSTAKDYFFKQIENLKNINDKKSLKDEKKKISKIDNKILNDGDNLLRFLYIGDSDFFNDSVTEILLARRYSLKNQSKNKRAGNPIVYESISEGLEVNFRISLKAIKNLNQKYDYFQQDEKSLKNIFGAMNLFSKFNIKRELKYLSNFESIINIYKNIENMIDDNNNSAIFRIGQGKTIFDNTILNIIDDSSIFNILYDNILKDKRDNKERTDRKLYPSTRTISITNNQPSNIFGWCKLEVL